MQWGLEPDRLHQDPRFGPSLQDNVAAMSNQWDPQRAHEFLLNASNPDFEAISPEQVKKGSPESGAAELLNALHSQLQEKVPGYAIQPPPV